MASSSPKLDLRVILETPVRQFIPWLGSVIIVTLAGYPGVVCVTPMAWLIALRVGNICAGRSKSEGTRQRLIESALAGGILGLLQGILFIVVAPLMGSLRADELANMIVFLLAMVFFGVIAAAGLSLFTAFLTEQRRKQETG